MSAADKRGRDELQRTALPNGLRVVTMRRPGALLAGIKLFLKVGSRHDGESPGIAHFLEHLLLANTGSKAARTAYDRVEGLGGAFSRIAWRIASKPALSNSFWSNGVRPVSSS